MAPRELHVAYRIFTKGALLLPRSSAVRLSRAVLHEPGPNSTARGNELSVVFAGSSRMRRLSRQFYPKHTAEILAFSMDPPVVGELVFCPELIARRAAAWGRTPSQHARHLFVHGLLHLYGYNHQRAQSARRMERLEKKICG